MARSSVKRSDRMKNKRPRKAKTAADEDDLVKTEIDAAEALAAFSKQACFPSLSDGETGTSELRWKGKRKRSRKCQMECSSSNMQLVVSNSAVDFPLVKDEYPSDSDKERGSSVPLVAYNRFDTSEDSLEPGFRAESPSSPLPPLGTEGYSTYVKAEVGLVQQSAFKPALDFDEKPARWNKQRGMKHPKLEELRTSYNTEVRKDRRPNGTGSGLKGRSSRAVLTEEEKEQRRLRRIEANRESARQTIRRKQKMCEEMTMKAAELTAANERMRKEIEAIRDEKKRLYETGCALRKQLADNSAAAPGVATSCSEDSVTVSAAGRPDQTVSSTGDSYRLPGGEPMIHMVQINRQDDSLESVEFATSQSQEPQISVAAPLSLKNNNNNNNNSNSNSNSSNNNNNNNNNRNNNSNINTNSNNYSNSRLLPQQGASLTSTQLSAEQFAKMVGAGLCAPNAVRGYFNCPPQQYSFYTGRKDALAAATAAQARRRRKELTRSKHLLSRQVSLNS